MSVIDIAVAMQHVRADDADLGHVQLLLDAAEDSVSQYINRAFYADADRLAAAVLEGAAGVDPIVISQSIVAACLLVLGHLYANREDVVVGTISSALPLGSRSLLAPYRVGLGV